MAHAWEPHWYVLLSAITDETDAAAEGVCSIGILLCVLCVNVFIAGEELWEGFETA